jgi:hypothetical protein
MSHVISLRPFTSIPDRATCQVPIRVGKSLIRGAGRGIFALENVLAGAPIFSIKKPLLNIIDDDLESLSHTCDNCFAAQVDGLWTVDNAGIKFEACQGCNLLHYCSKVKSQLSCCIRIVADFTQTCQSLAWKHHHQYECNTLKAIRADKDPATKFMLNKSNLRSMARILELHKHHQISQEEWNEFVSLSTGRKSKMKRPDFVIMANAVASIAKTFTMTELSLDEIIDLFCIVSTLPFRSVTS